MELKLRAKPQMSALGPAFGDNAPTVADAIRESDAAALSRSMTITVDDTTYDLNEEMVTFIEEPPEYASAANFENGTVYVDTTQTQELLSEGYAREIVRRIQEMRKDLDLDINQQAESFVVIPDDDIYEMVDSHTNLIAEETRTGNLELSDGSTEVGDLDREFGLVTSWEIRDVTVTIGVSPV